MQVVRPIGGSGGLTQPPACHRCRSDPGMLTLQWPWVRVGCGSSIPSRSAPERSCARGGPPPDVHAEPTVCTCMNALLLGDDVSGRSSVHCISVTRTEIIRTRRCLVRLPRSASETHMQRDENYS